MTRNTVGDFFKQLMGSVLAGQPANQPRTADIPANLDLESFSKECVTRGDALSGAVVNVGYGLLEHFATKRPTVKLPAKSDMTVENLFTYLDSVRTSDIEMENRESLFNIFQPIVLAFGGAILNGLLSGNKQPVVIIMQQPGQGQMPPPQQQPGLMPYNPGGGGGGFGQTPALARARVSLQDLLVNR